MNNLEIISNEVQELNAHEIKNIEGGCSFAYDVGYFLRQAFWGWSPPMVSANRAIYDTYCE